MANKKAIPELVEVRYLEYFKLFERSYRYGTVSNSLNYCLETIILKKYFLLPLKEPNSRIKEKCCQVRVQPKKFHTPWYSALSKYSIEPRWRVEVTEE